MTVYSHSRLSTYENCPLQYRLRYIDKVIIDEAETIEAFMGSRVHEVLEKLYRDMRLSRTNSIDDLLSFYNDNWQKYYSEEVRVIKEGYTPENYKDTGAKCIREYYARYQPFDDGKMLGLEQMIYFDIGGYKLRGFIDRLSSRKEGTYEIHDYKTSQHLPVQLHFDSDRQLALYQLGCRICSMMRVRLSWYGIILCLTGKSGRAGHRMTF